MLSFYKSVLGCGGSGGHLPRRDPLKSSKRSRVFTTSVTSISELPHTHITNGDTPHTLTTDTTNDRFDQCQDISSRAQHVLSRPSVTIKYNQKIGADIYDPDTNPQGYVDLGLAENKLCADLITEKLKSMPEDTDELELRYYPDVRGLSSFRNSLKKFIEDEFHPVKPLDVNNIVVACGVTALLDALGFALADEGDYIMTTSPYYYRIKNDFSERAAVNTLEVPLVAKPKTGWVKPYTLDVDAMIDAYLDAERKGQRVKALLLVNPNNPLGDVYSANQLSAVLDFAARYQLHVIVDEIYAMSIFDPDVKFTSVLSLYHPDPDRVHFLWGFSKDFGLSGYRCGVLYSKNQKLINYMACLGLYQQTAPAIQRRLKYLIDDTEWLRQTYFPALRERLHRNHKLFYDEITKCGVTVHHSSGGIFIWMDASMYLPQPTFKGEEWLFEQFLKEKVFLLPGQACYSSDPGYFRIVFTLEDSRSLEGIRRIQNVLRRIRPRNVPNGF
ncbi:unnamed protein product [Lymnaea stagnalis]|uniref:Aminotransferase class I/classII large domain-containing protein n=1 Tax=Lymnaea stagnalis TaxID=6523 RepID=A0AAV2ILI2_LYMST